MNKRARTAALILLVATFAVWTGVDVHSNLSSTLSILLGVEFVVVSVLFFWRPGVKHYRAWFFTFILGSIVTLFGAFGMLASVITDSYQVSQTIIAGAIGLAGIALVTLSVRQLQLGARS